VNCRTALADFKATKEDVANAFHVPISFFTTKVPPGRPFKNSVANSPLSLAGQGTCRTAVIAAIFSLQTCPGRVKIQLTLWFTLPMNTTPASLLERLRLPHPERDWDRFVELYTPLLLAWTRRLRVAPEDAEDVVQDVFLTLFRKLPGFRYDPRQRFRGWLWQVLKNKCIDRKRKRLPASANVAEIDGLADPEGLEALWEAEHRQWLTRRALELMQAEFQPTTWKACWEFLVNGRPAAVVAAQLGITENAVFIAKFRVIRRLKEELAGLREE